MSKEELPFLCGNCGERFGWGDNSSAPIFLGVVRSLPFNNEPTPCCGNRISGFINRDLEMTLTAEGSTFGTGSRANTEPKSKLASAPDTKQRDKTQGGNNA